MGSRGVEAVGPKEPSGRIRSQNLSVEEHTDDIRVPWPMAGMWAAAPPDMAIRWGTASRR